LPKKWYGGKSQANTGSAGALARYEREARNSYGFKKFEIERAAHAPAGEGARAPSTNRLVPFRIDFLGKARTAVIIQSARFSIDEPISFVLRMALDALEHRNVAEVHGMLEWLIALVAELAFVIGERAKIDGMFKSASLNILFSRSSRVVEYRVADGAVVADHFARVADVLAIVTAKTPREIKMTNIVRMRLPIGLHFRKEICAKDSLDFGNRAFD